MLLFSSRIATANVSGTWENTVFTYEGSIFLKKHIIIGRKSLRQYGNYFMCECLGQILTNVFESRFPSNSQVAYDLYAHYLDTLKLRCFQCCKYIEAGENLFKLNTLKRDKILKGYLCESLK